jgi:hypothetical protein
MITISNPSITCVRVAREMLDALADHEFGAALKRLDKTGRKWSKDDLATAVQSATGSWVGSWRDIKRSAKPEVTRAEGRDYVLKHRLPVNGKWHGSKIVLRFRWKTGAYYHVELEAFLPPEQPA